MAKYMGRDDHKRDKKVLSTALPAALQSTGAPPRQAHEVGEVDHVGLEARHFALEVPGYVDGFVLAVPKKNLAAYRKMAKLGARVWKEHGALDYRECVGDDLSMPMGVPFTRLARLKPGELVVFRSSPTSRALIAIR